MVQEVVRRNPELQLLHFAEVEVLEQREIAIEECRSENLRSHNWPVTAWGGGKREAAPVHELVVSQILSGIAGQNGFQRYGVGTVDSARRDVKSRSRQLESVGVQVEVRAVIVFVRRKIDSALDLSDT